MSSDGWKRRGACRVNPAIDPDLFFTTDEFRSPKTKRQHLSVEERLAIEVCEKCPVSGNCLTYALDNPRLLGIWGGTTTDMRKALRKVRQRASCVRCERGRLLALNDGTQVCTRCGLTYMKA
jgi:WhiB family transcriptional regulator, redox-sensing transcriptional regulator